MAGITFNADGSVYSTESGDALALGATKTNPFNWNTGLGIPSADLTEATSRSVVGRDGDALAARAAGVSVNYTGAQRVIIGGPTDGGPVTTHDPVQINMAEVPNGEQGVLSTATRHGVPRSADELRPDDRVTVGGYETTVRNAINLGFLSKDRVGNVANVSDEQIKEVDGTASAERAAAQAAKDQADALAAQEAAKLSPEAEEAAQMLATRVDEGTQVRALIELADAGEVSDRAINAAASQAGIDPSDMRAALGKALDGYSEQATEFLASRGVDPTAFYQWAKVNRASDLKAALIGHVQHRNVAAYALLADHYMTHLDKIDPQSILAGTFPDGGSAHYDPGTRTVVLSIPGHGTMSWAAAPRAGLIGPHRRG